MLKYLPYVLLIAAVTAVLYAWGSTVRAGRSATCSTCSTARENAWCCAS